MRALTILGMLVGFLAVAGPVRVFILAGQSNMEGRGFPEPLSWQITQPEYRERYTHFIKDGDYDAFTKAVADSKDPNDPRKTPTYLWSERKDVWINYLGKHGNLTVSYGAPREGFGPEFNFGHVVGDAFEDQVLIIKTSWGGRALAHGFLPPSSMLSDAEYAKLNAEANSKIEVNNAKQKAKAAADSKYKPRLRDTLSDADFKDRYGKDYRNMVAEVHGCLAALKERFPSYNGQGYEIQGFVWFQGWNDQYNDNWLSYEKNLANLIRDLRKEFKAPNMKVVIGQMGHDGPDESKPDSPRGIIMAAQATVPTLPEFVGNTICVDTRQYWDMEAHAIYNGPGAGRRTSPSGANSAMTGRITTLVVPGFSLRRVLVSARPC